MDTDKVDLDEVLSRSTVRDDLALSVAGTFPSQDDAQNLLYTVLGFTKVFGSVFDLSALDGITVSDDYVAALGSIDRGYGSIVVIGTGGTSEPFHKMAHPLEFRSQVQQQIEKLRPGHEVPGGASQGS